MTHQTMSIPHNPLEGPRPELSIDLQSGTDEQVSIIVVHKDRPAHLNICLQSIVVTSSNHNYEIIVVDNNSDKEGQDFLDDISSEVRVIRNDKNLYWSAAANKGADAADKNSKYLVFLHCDVVIENPAWLDILINVAESQKSGLVGVEMQSFKIGDKKVDFVRDWLVLFSKECWKSCGPFPEKLPLIGSSFIPTIKAQHHGFKPQVIKHPVAHHYKIFSLDINEFERLTEQAMVTIPQLIKEVQSETVTRVI